jgi:hypothetical protein
MAATDSALINQQGSSRLPRLRSAATVTLAQPGDCSEPIPSRVKQEITVIQREMDEAERRHTSRHNPESLVQLRYTCHLNPTHTIERHASPTQQVLITWPH